MKNILIAFWAVLAASAFAGEAAASAASGKILFISTRDGVSQIYSMNADGSGQTALTQGREENTDPALSPDGTRIAFTSYRDGNAEIYAMNADGTAQKRLTSDEASDTSPAWTPDGRIVFRSNRDRWTNFYVVSADGGNLKQLSATPLDKGAPVLSPDGRSIAFVAHEPRGSSDICVMSANGGEHRNLTASLSKNKKFSPSWAPDGSRLIYVEAKDPVLNIFAINPDGSNSVKITDNFFSNASPIWSPDGKRIAFVSSREGDPMQRARGDIYLMNADGSGAINLTRTADEENYPAWAADGSAIYFVSLHDGSAQIYSVAAEGGAQKRLTNNQGSNVMIVPFSRKQMAPLQPRGSS